MTEPLTLPLQLRGDTTVYRRDSTAYIATSQGVFKVHMPANSPEAVTSLSDELQRKGFAAPSAEEAPNPGYRPGVTVTALDHPVTAAAASLLAALPATVVTIPAGAPPVSGDTVLIPLDADAEVLDTWNEHLLQQPGTRVIAFLATPVRLLVAVLDAPRTPCLHCLSVRLRANHPAQEIAGIGLGALYGAAASARWPATALAASYLAHLASAEQCLETGTALDLRFAGTATQSRVLPLPGCPYCGPGQPQPDSAELARQAVSSGEWSRAGACRDRLAVAVNPLTGIVGSAVADRADGFYRTRTAGRSNTLWFSDVQAQAMGAAVKHDPDTAHAAALGEAYERYACGIYRRANLIRASLSELGPLAVDPRSLPLGSQSEYRALGGRLNPYRPDLQIDWAEGASLVTGERRCLPACAVFVPYKAPRAAERLLRPISTGLAAGSTPAEAVLAGLLEIIERDSFVIAWENELVLPTIDIAGLPAGPARDALEAIKASSGEFLCKLTTTDVGIPSVVLCSVQRDGSRPLTTFSSRADVDLLSCLLHAAEEHMLSRTSVRSWVAQFGCPEDGQPLRQMRDFFTYYCREDRLPKLDFLRAGPVLGDAGDFATGRPPSPGAAVADVVRHIAAAGYEPFVVDLTPSDVRLARVTVARSIVPGMQPVTFGRDFRHLGGRRLYEAPVRMGARDRARLETELNPNPMPGG